ncbi:MAG: hypothetical protein EOM91_20740 [Sphingobacteriia bacterium]|nr:hypothetical protein [Sphingobacteriia bacterium]NCC41338.1 hypothetical protein [Gammaproteobacteria bacterium]
MPRYSEAFKAKVVEKMMPPNARTVADVHRETGARVVESSPLRFDRTNDQGQRIYRGHVGGMADVVLVDLAETQPRAGSEISVGYDGRWGRGVCGVP